MIRILKLIDIIRDKNINLYGLHLYFSIVERLIWKKILKFSELFFNRESWCVMLARWENSSLMIIGEL
jgi:hypothetical protein